MRVFISYAHDDREHEERVRGLWVFLRACGVDARLDLAAAADRVDWAEWMTREVRDADRVLIVASPAYKRRAEGDAGPGEGRGVQWEARLIRDLFYADQSDGIKRFIPVVLPGCSGQDIPAWLAPASAAHYRVTEFTVAGAEALLRMLTGQPGVVASPLGVVPVLPPEGSAAVGVAGRRGVHTEVVIEAGLAGGVVESAVWAAGSLVCRRRELLPPGVAGVWGALRLPGVLAGERLAAAGRALAGVLLTRDGQELVAGLLEGMTAQDTAEVVLCAAGDALGLPVELIRLRTAGGGETAPLGMMSAVAVSRRPCAPLGGAADAPPARPFARAAPAGPLKVLAAVAAPEETKTPNPPLDAEAEMAAVLDAVAGITAGGQVRILEVASLAAIRQALAEDAYHVLHLSAHGSPEVVELEDEDGTPVTVSLAALVEALRLAGRVVPLIVLASCSGGASAGRGVGGGAGRAGRGPGDRDARPGHRRVRHRAWPGTCTGSWPPARTLTAGQALARARYLAEDDPPPGAGPGGGPGVRRGHAGGRGRGRPAGRPGAPPKSHWRWPRPRQAGRLVRDLPMGALIGRRAQLRAAVGVLRRDAGGGGPVRGVRRGGAHRDRGDRQDRAGRAGDGPAGR